MTLTTQRNAGAGTIIQTHTQSHTDIAAYRLKRPRGRLSEHSEAVLIFTTLTLGKTEDNFYQLFLFGSGLEKGSLEKTVGCQYMVAVDINHSGDIAH